MAFSHQLEHSLKLWDDRRRAQGAEAASLSSELDDLLLTVEADTGGELLASVLILSTDGKRLLDVSAPSLPQGYRDSIHGIEIGPSVGSCGTAAYLGHPVYVTDIATDPLWSDFADLALSHGLRACWSTPIENPDGGVLGTFAIYHRSPRSPTLDEVAAIRRVTGRVAEVLGRASDLG
jgi:GAF domain-containing protein